MGVLSDRQLDSLLDVCRQAVQTYISDPDLSSFLSDKDDETKRPRWETCKSRSNNTQMKEIFDMMWSRLTFSQKISLTKNDPYFSSRYRKIGLNPLIHYLDIIIPDVYSERVIDGVDEYVNDLMDALVSAIQKNSINRGW